MDILSSLCFLATLYYLLVTLITQRSKLEISVSVVSFILSLYPFILGLVEFFLSPRSKVLRIKYALYKALYGEFFDDKMDDLFSSGRPIYCNPFLGVSRSCLHDATLEVSQDSNSCIVFPNAVGINSRFRIPESDHVSNQFLINLGLKYLDTIDRKNRYTVSGTNLVYGFIHALALEGCTMEYSIVIDGTEVALTVTLSTGVIECRVIRPSSAQKVDYIHSDNKSYLKVIDILEYIKSTGRSCCFVADSKSVVGKDSMRIHCMTVCDLILNISLGKGLSLGKNLKFKVVEGVKTWEVLLKSCAYRYLGGEIETIKGYLESSHLYKSNVDEIMGAVVLKRTWPSNIAGLGNWGTKRLGVDLSYLLELLGCCRLKKVDLSINPTLRVQGFAKMNKGLIEKERESRIPGVTCFGKLTKKAVEVFTELKGSGALKGKEDGKARDFLVSSKWIGPLNLISKKNSETKSHDKGEAIVESFEFTGSGSLSRVAKRPKAVVLPPSNVNLVRSTSFFTKPKSERVPYSGFKGMTYLEALLKDGCHNSVDKIEISSCDLGLLNREREEKACSILSESAADGLFGESDGCVLNRKKRGNGSWVKVSFGGSKFKAKDSKVLMSKMFTVNKTGVLKGGWANNGKRAKAPSSGIGDSGNIYRYLAETKKSGSYVNQIMSKARRRLNKYKLYKEKEGKAINGSKSEVKKNPEAKNPEHARPAEGKIKGKGKIVEPAKVMRVEKEVRKSSRIPADEIKVAWPGEGRQMSPPRRKEEVVEEKPSGASQPPPEEQKEIGDETSSIKDKKISLAKSLGVGPSHFPGDSKLYYEFLDILYKAKSEKEEDPDLYFESLEEEKESGESSYYKSTDQVSRLVSCLEGIKKPKMCTRLGVYDKVDRQRGYETFIHLVSFKGAPPVYICKVGGEIQLNPGYYKMVEELRRCYRPAGSADIDVEDLSAKHLIGQGPQIFNEIKSFMKMMDIAYKKKCEL
jgi:hypothetical protein